MIWTRGVSDLSSTVLVEDLGSGLPVTDILTDTKTCLCVRGTLETQKHYSSVHSVCDEQCQEIIEEYSTAKWLPLSGSGMCSLYQ